MRSAREALTASRRAPLLSALGIVTIAFSLFTFGLFGLAIVASLAFVAIAGALRRDALQHSLEAGLAMPVSAVAVRSPTTNCISPSMT